MEHYTNINAMVQAADLHCRHRKKNRTDSIIL